MGVNTPYDNLIENLHNKLSECLEIARQMLDEDIWGYHDRDIDYAITVYLAIKNARDKV